MEIERKYLISSVPFDFSSYPCRKIEQGYLSTSPVVRIRRDNNDYILTYKSKGMMIREEYNLPLTKESYEHLKEKIDGRLITKKRYVIPLEDSLFIELDIFSGGEEYNLPLTKESYEHLKEKIDGRLITKKRYVIPLEDSLFIELDIFSGALAPLILAEVEFPDEETANHFTPPEWFGEDVTFSSSYHNSILSKL